MFREPRKSYGAELNRRNKGTVDAQNAADKLFEDPKIQLLWSRGDEKSILKLCKTAEMDVGAPAYTTATMIFKILKAKLKHQKL